MIGKGVAVNDIFIMIPNGLGAVLGVLQFILYVSFPLHSHKRQKSADRSISGIFNGDDVSGSSTEPSSGPPIETTPLI